MSATGSHSSQPGGPPPLPPHPTAAGQPPYARPPHAQPPFGHAGPVSHTAPAAHAHAGSGAPPLQVAFPEQRPAASLYAPPRELDAEEESPVPARGGSEWMIWAVPVLALVVMGA